MVYLDYSATTPVNSEVLSSFCDATINYPGNPNSLHRLGTESKHLIDEATNQIANILKVKASEIIYTSCSSESNNLAIKGIANKYKKRGNHIITTTLEHSSIYGPINYLTDNGFEVDFVNIDEFGRVDLNHLKSLIRETTILVTINSVNSETGIVQPIGEIGELLKKHPKCFFHSDMTQSIGKINIPLDNIDLVSFSAHKFYGLKGIGCLIKKENILLEPIIHGGKSTTLFRSGTPALPLIVSTSKALRLISEKLDSNYSHVLDLNNYLKEKLKNYNKVFINSNQYSIPHILNISVIGIKPETLLHALERDDIFISTQSACSTNNSASKTVLAITRSEERANYSVRISIAGLTTKEEVDKLLASFDKNYHQLLK